MHQMHEMHICSRKNKRQYLNWWMYNNTGTRKWGIPQILRNKWRSPGTTQKMHKIISKENLYRMRLILKSSLSPRNKTKAINQFAVPVFQYDCAINNWPQLEINNLDTKTRKVLTIHKIFHKKQCIPRLYLLKWEGGGGLMELNQVHKTTCEGMAEHVKNSTDYWMRFVHEQENNRPEKGSLIHFATSFQKQVQMMDTTQEKERETTRRALSRPHTVTDLETMCTQTARVPVVQLFQ